MARKLNVFFDVDHTLVMWDGRLRNHAAEVFQAGSREFDPVKVGLAPVTGFWEFDTSKAGNSNRGHEFTAGFVEGSEPKNGVIGPLLTHEQRLAIIEHLKVRNDDVDGPQEPAVPTWAQCSSSPGYRPLTRIGKYQQD